MGATVAPCEQRTSSVRISSSGIDSARASWESSRLRFSWYAPLPPPWRGFPVIPAVRPCGAARGGGTVPPWARGRARYQAEGVVGTGGHEDLGDAQNLAVRAVTP